MNRRGFIGRLAAVAAAAPLAQTLTDGQGDSLSPRDTVSPGDAMSPGTSPGVETATSTEPVRDLLELRRERGLLVPCPNCHVVAWKRYAPDRIECSGCGWKDEESRFAEACRCADCSRIPDRARQKPVDADIDLILLTSPGGFYRVTEPNGAPVTREQRNGYDVSTDRWLHNVVERRLARVVCGVGVAVREQRPGFYGSTDRLEREDGNVVFFQWEIVDCYEWQQERGEKPELLQETDARGYTWVRHQSAPFEKYSRDRGTVVLCSCDDYMSCEHPYPTRLKWPGHA